MSEDDNKDKANSAPQAKEAAGNTGAADSKQTPDSSVAAKPSAADQPKEDSSAQSDKPDGQEARDDKPKAAPTAADLLKDDLGDIKIRRAKGSKNIISGLVHILATFNNTKVTFSDAQGNVISWSSAGKCNFRGSRKSTAYAAQVVTQDAGRKAMSHGLKEVAVRLKGPGMGRDSAVRALQALGLTVTSIIDVTPIPHNGCRPPKRRRV